MWPVFFLTSLALTYIAANRGVPKDLMQQGVTQKAAEPPAKSSERATVHIDPKI